MARQNGPDIDMRVRWNSSSLDIGLANLDNEVRRAMSATVAYIAPQAEAWAKSNAPWTDQTGNARNGLTARPSGGAAGRGAVARVTVAHSVPYGIWLEVRWSGRYAIVKKTVDHFFPQAMLMVGRMLNLR